MQASISSVRSLSVSGSACVSGGGNEVGSNLKALQLHSDDCGWLIALNV